MCVLCFVVCVTEGVVHCVYLVCIDGYQVLFSPLNCLIEGSSSWLFCRLVLCASHVLVSSTYSTVLQMVCKSLRCTRRPAGPNRVPCDIPALIVFQPDTFDPRFTRCCPWHEKGDNHLTRKLGRPRLRIFFEKTVWSTRSNAFEKSNRSSLTVRLCMSSACSQW